MITRRTALTAGLAAAVAGRFTSARAANMPGVTATEIKIGNTMPYSGPASSYSVIGQGRGGLLQDGQRAGRRRRSQDQLHLARRRLQPAENGGGHPPTGRGRRGGFLLPDARHADQFGDRQVYEPQQGAAALRRFRCQQVERCQEVSVDHGLAAELPHRSADLHEIHAGEREESEAGHPLSERRLRQGLPAGRARHPGQGLGQDRHQVAELRDHRRHHQFADRRAARFRRQRAAGVGDPEVRRAVDPQGLRPAMEADVLHDQRVDLRRHGDAAGGTGEVRRHAQHAIPEGSDRPGMEGRCGDQGLAGVHGEVQSQRRHRPMRPPCSPTASA